jgi:spore germination protein KA
MWRTIKKSMNQQPSSKTAENKQPEPKEPLSSQFNVTMEKLHRTFEKSSDVVIREIQLGKRKRIKAAIVFTEGLVDSPSIRNGILESLMSEESQLDIPSELLTPSTILDWVKNNLITLGSVKEVRDYETLYKSVLSGSTIIILEGVTQALSTATEGWKDRGVQEPGSQTVVRGPRESFSESLRVNTALVRRKIKDSNLCCESKVIGRVTKTSIAIMYIKGIVTDSIVTEVHERLDRIDIDGILESGYIEELIQDQTFTPFPTVFNTERPDTVAACLLEGRVAILVDGTPFVLVVPSLFVQSFQAAEDYYQRSDISTLIRMLRIICFAIALLGPSFYIAVTTYHQEIFPTRLLINLAAQREGVPFPAFIEAMIMEITFEILREAGIRMPRAVGQAVSIVGALVLGQAAVEAGIISASMVIVVSITAIANFVFPAYNMAIAVRMLRFGMMFLAASFGLYGVTLGLLALLLHLNSLRSFGIPYMAPFAPFIADDQKDGILRLPLWGLFSRPRLINQKNVTREQNPLTSKPNN